MIRNSVGIITEIISMLDKNSLSGEQVEKNYEFLVEKWGEWIIVGDSNGLFSIRFVDIRKAFFSGLMATFLALGLSCLIIAIIVGKVVFPKLAVYFTDNNQDMVNIATLQTHAEVTKNNRKDKEGWF